MVLHQCEQFCNNPCLVQKHAIRRITKYLTSMSTYVYLPNGTWGLSTHGVVYNTSKEKDIKCYVDAEFPEDGIKQILKIQEISWRVREYVIACTWCPVLWCIKLQTEIALITTEEEYIELSKEMRDVVPFMLLIKEA